MLRPNEIDHVIRQIVARVHPLKIILYGSYAKGVATIKSDLDLFVIQETDLSMTHRVDDLRPMLTQFLVPIDVHIYTPQEVEVYGGIPLSFVRCVLDTGKIVFQK